MTEASPSGRPPWRTRGTRAARRRSSARLAWPAPSRPEPTPAHTQTRPTIASGWLHAVTHAAAWRAAGAQAQALFDHNYPWCHLCRFGGQPARTGALDLQGSNAHRDVPSETAFNGSSIPAEPLRHQPRAFHDPASSSSLRLGFQAWAGETGASSALWFLDAMECHEPPCMCLSPSQEPHHAPEGPYA